MGRSSASSFEFSSRAPKVKKRRASERRNATDAKLARHNDSTTRLSRVSEVGEEEESRPQGREEGQNGKQRRWSLRMRRGTLMTPVTRYLARFRQSWTSITTIAGAPFRWSKLGTLLTNLHLSRRRNSRRIHSLLATSSPSDEHAPLLPRLQV